MTTKSRYAEQLRDPRWQKRRLKVLEAADWTCEECGAKSRELHVHHGYYGKGMAPWDYPADTLHVLCNDCHAVAEALLAEIREKIGRLQFVDLTSLNELLGAGVPRQPDEFDQFDVEPPDPDAIELQRMLESERARHGINADGTLQEAPCGR